LETKIPYIEEHNIRLANRMKNFFRQLGWELPNFPLGSSFCALQPPQPYTSMQLTQKLAEHQVFAAVRAGYLRMTPHLYNSEKDIDRFCSLFKSIL